MRVSSLTYQLVRGGMLDGLLTFVVGLSEGSPHLTASSLIEKILAHPQGMNKMVLITGDIGSESTDMMNAFTTALKNLGYVVGVETDGNVYPTWFSNVSHVRVNLKPDSIWLRHNCMEVVLTVESPNDPEPPLPSNPALLYVVSDSVKTSVDFVKGKSSKNKWMVRTKGKSSYTEVLYQAVTAEGNERIALRSEA